MPLPDQKITCSQWIGLPNNSRIPLMAIEFLGEQFDATLREHCNGVLPCHFDEEGHVTSITPPEERSIKEILEDVCRKKRFGHHNDPMDIQVEWDQEVHPEENPDGLKGRFKFTSKTPE